MNKNLLFSFVIVLFSIGLTHNAFAIETAHDVSGLSVATSSAPVLLAPVNHQHFTQKELVGDMKFRWTPLVPRPQEPVTYRLRVWQLIQGQTGTQAMRSNQPIVTKEVINFTELTTGVITGPCKPPYMCDFVWNVQAIGKTTATNEIGTSDTFSFSAQQSDPALQKIARAYTRETEEIQKKIEKRKAQLDSAQTKLNNLRTRISELESSTDAAKIKELKATIKKELTGTVSLLK